MDKNKALSKKWWKVAQYLAGYLVAAWTFLQFLEWILNRYQISPHWVDIFLWFFVGIIPSLIIYLFHQDRINQRILKLREKIIFPINVILVFIGLYFGFGTTDLGATTKEIAYVDALGEMNQTTITKEEFRTEVPIYNFQQLNENDELKWMGEGISELLYYDLLQDKNITPSLNWARSTADKVLEASVAASIYVDGTYEKNGDTYTIETKIRNSKNGNVKESQTFTGDDFLDLIDEVSVYVRGAIALPEGDRMQYLDLSIKEFVSTSLPAIKNFVYSNFEEAIAQDSTFALAYLKNSRRDIRYSRGKIDEQALADKAYQYRERLPYDLRMEAMANKYLAYNQFDKAKELVEMQLEISPQNQSLNNILYGIYGETKDAQSFYDTALKRFSASKSFYNIQNIADATLVNGDYEDYLKMVNLYVKLNPGNNFIFPFSLPPLILKGDEKAARSTYDKVRLVHPNQDNINKAFEPAIDFLAEDKVDQDYLNSFVGVYRSHQSEATVDLWVDDDRLLNYYSNQTIRIMIPSGDAEMVIGEPNQYSGFYSFKKDDSGEFYCAKVDENYDNTTIPYWIWKLDDTITEAEELLQQGDYEKAEPAYEAAINANQNHYYLKYALQHIQYVKDKDSTQLIEQYNKVVGTYSKEGVENTRKLFVKDGKLMYKRSGIPSKQLFPISENRYLTLSSYRLHFEFEFEGDEAVASFSWVYDPEKGEWENYGAELNYLFKE
ncbi:MAG: hypothetical protein HRT65_05350 [Flavobacteriaceae bacterium]|nr:hypothetical protein [Flavobacteriaceae bacterium]